MKDDHRSYTTFTVGKRKPEKNSGLYGIRTLDQCDTGAALYQLRYHPPSGTLLALIGASAFAFNKYPHKPYIF